jgi:hypothetical protein
LTVDSFETDNVTIFAAGAAEMLKDVVIVIDSALSITWQNRVFYQSKNAANLSEALATLKTLITKTRAVFIL